MTAPVKIYSQKWPEGAAGLAVRKDPDHNHQIPYIREDVVKELADALRFMMNTHDTPIARRKISGEYAEGARVAARDALKKVEDLL